MKVNLLRVRCKAEGNVSIPMAESMMENGLTIKCMGKENVFSQEAMYTKENI